MNVAKNSNLIWLLALYIGLWPHCSQISVSPSATDKSLTNHWHQSINTENPCGLFHLFNFIYSLLYSNYCVHVLFSWFISILIATRLFFMKPHSNYVSIKKLYHEATSSWECFFYFCQSHNSFFLMGKSVKWNYNRHLTGRHCFGPGGTKEMSRAYDVLFTRCPRGGKGAFCYTPTQSKGLIQHLN